MIKSLMILAAGAGVRMSSLTTKTPKSLVVVHNKPILWHVLEFALKYGKFEKIIINTHFFATLINDSVQNFQKLHNHNCEIITIYESTPLETGGAIKNVYEYFADEEAIFTTNADAFCLDNGINIYDNMRAKWQPDNMDCLLLLNKQNNVIGQKANDYAIIGNSGALIARKSNLATQNLVFYTYTGCQITKPSLFASCKETVFRIYDIQSRNRCFGIINDGQFCHINNPQQLQEVEDACAKHNHAIEN